MKLLDDELYVGFNELGHNQAAGIHAINTHTGTENRSAIVRWNARTFDLA
jgi:hypothetical protein